METIMILGQEFSVIEKEDNKDSVELTEKKVILRNKTNKTDVLLRDYLTELLYTKISTILKDITNQRKIEIIGNLDFEIVDKIDQKKNRIAKLNRNKIQIKQNAIALPEEALRYIIAHELAHTFKKRHTKNFWKIVEKMCPNFKRGRKLIQEFKEPLLIS